MGDQVETARACPATAEEFFAEGDRAVSALREAVAAALAGEVSPGAFFDGAMEILDRLPGYERVRALMRAQAREWHAAGYAARDAEIQAEQEAQEQDRRHGMRLVG